MTGPPELGNPLAALGSIPRLRSRHSVIVSSITIFVSSSSEISTCRSNLTHSRSRRTQLHGSDQSSRITTSVSGILCGVKRGFRSGAKDGDGSERRYAETRARVSIALVRLTSAVTAYLPSWSASRTSWYVYPSANWFAIGGVLPFRFSFGRLGSCTDSVSRNSRWLSGVPPA